MDVDLWPAQWAEAHLRLGQALLQVPGDELTTEQALTELRLALRVFSGKAYPSEAADTYVAIASALLRDAEDVGGDFAEAIAALHSALERVEGTGDTFRRAVVNRLLCEAHRLRNDGDHAANVEYALGYGKLAVELWNTLGDGEREAIARYSVACALLDRDFSDRASNIDLAIEQLERALSLAVDTPTDRGRIDAMLGAALFQRAQIDMSTRKVDLERAAKHLRRGLDLLTAGDDRGARVRTQLNLALLAVEQDRLPEARAHAEAVLAEPNVGRSPFILARANDVLGQVFMRTPEDRTLAIDHLERAVEAYAAAGSLDASRATLRRLGTIHLEASDWQRASVVLEEAIATAERESSSTYTARAREGVLASVTGLHADAALCRLRLGDPDGALSLLERGKDQLLNRQLDARLVEAETLSADDRTRFREAWMAVRHLERELRRAEVGVPALCERLRVAQDDLAGVIESIRDHTPDFLRDRLDATDVVALAPPGGALVIPLVATTGGAVFVVPHGTRTLGAEHVVHLSCTHADTQRLLGGDDGRSGWMGGYLAWRTSGEAEAWHRTVEQTAAQLWTLLMGQVAERLRELGIARGASVVILPHGPLAFLPLAIASRGEGASRRYFLDDFTVTFAPSVRMLALARARVPRHRHDMLVVSNPTGDVVFAASETAAIQSASPGVVRVLYGPEATCDAVQRLADEFDYLHLGCHAFFHWSNVELSGLELADGTLTVDDIETSGLDLSAVRLVTLSSCESGVTKILRRVAGNLFTNAADEYTGLPACFLQAGAAAVLATSWPVDDYATALLTEAFYTAHLVKERPVGQALRMAQRWVRSLRCDELRTRVSAELDALDARPNESEDRLYDALDELLTDLEAIDGAARPLTRPFFWGAFTAIGAA